MENIKNIKNHDIFIFWYFRKYHDIFQPWYFTSGKSDVYVLAAAATRGFTMVLLTEPVSRRNTFVWGTCAPPSALLVLFYFLCPHITIFCLGIIIIITNVKLLKVSPFYRKMNHYCCSIPQFHYMAGRVRSSDKVVFCADHYCQAQFFIANCTRPGHVVLMQHARYGRMKLGLCNIGGSTNVAGCSDDVLWYLDRRCSGRTHCKVYIADPVLHHLNPCTSDYTAYLQAKYTCVSGTDTR